MRGPGCGSVGPASLVSAFASCVHAAKACGIDHGADSLYLVGSFGMRCTLLQPAPWWSRGGERERYKQGKDGHEDQGLEALHERDSIDGFPAHIPQGEGAGASSRGMGTLVALQEKRKGLSQVLPCRQ